MTDRDDIVEALGVVAAAIDARDWTTLRERFTPWVRTDAGWQISRRWFDIRIELGDPAVLRPAG